MEIINKVLSYIEQDDYGTALDLILQNEIKLAGNVDFMKAKALLTIRTGEYRTAIRILKQAKELEPNDSEIYYYLSCAYESLENNNIDDSITIINSDDKEPVTYTDDLNLYKNRAAMQQLIEEKDSPLVSIVFIAFNNLEKLTKPAIECLLKYTRSIDYELILIDNGSSDGTFEYFKSIPYKKKRIYRITKNIGAAYGYVAAKNTCCGSFARGKYVVSVPNDVLVTENWLVNMLKCIDSDETIGMVVPMTDNASNLQTVNLGYCDFKDMQKKAANFNVSDPRKWEERMRIIPFVWLCRKETLTIWAEGDSAFIYNFSDDDISFRYRRDGYKLMLCGDVFVHHEGNSIGGKNPEKLAADIEKGRQIFREKYHGIDAWDDVNNYEKLIFGIVNLKGRPDKKTVQVLGIDVRCGTPLLEFKNKLKLIDEFQTNLSAFTGQAKYWLDLKTICNGEVVCDRIEYLSEYFAEKTFDYIFLGEPINQYPSPYKILESLMIKLTADGNLIIKLKNNFNINHFIHMLQGNFVVHEVISTNLSLMDIKQFIESRNYKLISCNFQLLNVDESEKNLLIELIRKATNQLDVTESVNKLLTEEITMIIGKNNK